MISDTGYNTYLFGRVNAWKNAMSVQATRGGEGHVTAETEAYSSMSANLPSQSLVFLDQVDADVTAQRDMNCHQMKTDFYKWHVCIGRQKIYCVPN